MLFLDARTGLALGMPAEPVDKPKRMNAARLLGDTSPLHKPQTASQVVNTVSDTRTGVGMFTAISLFVGRVPGLFLQEDPQPASITVPLLRCPYWTSAHGPSPQRPSPTVQARPSWEMHRGWGFRDPGVGGAGDPSGVGVGPAGSQTHSDSLLGADPLLGTHRRTLSTTPRHTPGPRAPRVQMKMHL